MSEGGGKTLKKLILITTVAGFLGSIGAAAQEKSADPGVTAEPNAVTVSAPAQQASYSPNDIKILGTLNSGQTSKPVVYSRAPRYRAFVFEGNGRDRFV